MDGYIDAQTIENYTESETRDYKKFLYLQELYENQKRIDAEIAVLSSEIDGLPKLPESMDRWIGSFRSNFKISDLTKIFKINKKYRNLMEERRSNGRKIKIFAIENVLEQIKDTEKPVISDSDE
jgi:hypothetical protein